MKQALIIVACRLAGKADMQIRLLDRYIGGAVAGGVLMTLLVLLGLFMLFEVVEQLEDYGRGDYGLRAIAVYALLRIPRLCYDLFPISGLIGALLGLSMLAQRRELAVMRCAGLSRADITLAVMKAGLIFMVCAMCLGEFVSPYAELYATNYRLTRMHGYLPMRGDAELWLRDGDTYVNILRVKPDGDIAGLLIHEFDDDRKLRTTTYASEAEFQGRQWILRSLAQTRFVGDQVVTEYMERATWDSMLRPDLVTVVIIKPELNSIWALSRYIEYLRTNGQSAQQYEYALWSKLIYPLATGVMVLLAVPVVLGRAAVRTATTRYVIVGTLVGIGFFLINKLIGNFGIVADLPPALSAAGPTVIIALAAVLLLRRST